MSDINILNQMIKDDVKLALAEKHNKKHVKLTEHEHDYSVIINGLPDNVIVIKADTFKSPDTVFNGSRGECKRADFVIIADSGNKKVILYIEIKATKDSEKEIIKQLKGAQCFVAYCKEIGKLFWDHKEFLKDYAHRFISIVHISISKQKTRIKPQIGVHDRPDRMMKISSPNHRGLQFNQLAGTL